MPKLPDSTVLGGIPSGNSGRPIATFDTTAPGKAMETLGKGISDLGKGIAGGLNGLKENLSQEDELAEMKAKSGFLTEQVKLDEEEKNETDPEKLKLFPERRQEAFTKWQQTIPDPKRRERWGLDMAPRLAAKTVGTNDRVAGIEKDRFLADTNDQIDLMRELIIDPEVDADTRQLAIETAGDYIDQMESKGYITAEQAQQRRKKWVETYTWDRVKMMPAEQRAYAVGGLEGLLIGRESSGHPDLQNNWGFSGLYQFGAPRLETLGLYTPGADEDLKGWNKSLKNAPGKWSGTFNIPGFPQVKTIRDFLDNPDAQRKAFEIHNGKMDQEIAAMGFDQYIGKTIGGVTITRDGLKAMIHLGGAGNTQKLLQSGGAENAQDANGTRLLSYAKMASGDGGVANILPPDKRQQLRDETYRELEQARRDREQRSRIEISRVTTQIADDEASIASTGKPLADLTPKKVEDTLGADARVEFEQKRFHASRYYEQTRDFDSVSEAEIGERLGRLDPRKNGDAGKPGFREATSWYEKAYEKAKGVIKERNADPAAAADKQSDVAEVKKSADINQPATYQPLVKARMEAQKRLGVTSDNQVPFTNAEARAIFQPVSRALPGQEKEAIEQTVQLLQTVLGKDNKDLIEKALEQGLKISNVDKAQREVAARILRKLGQGEDITAADKRAMDEARKQDAQAKAAAPLAALASPGVTSGGGQEQSGVAALGSLIGTRGVAEGKVQLTPTEDDVRKLWDSNGDLTTVQAFYSKFGPDVTRTIMSRRPPDWNPALKTPTAAPKRPPGTSSWFTTNGPRKPERTPEMSDAVNR